MNIPVLPSAPYVSSVETCKNFTPSMNSEEYLVDYPLGYNSDGKYIKVDVLSGSYVIVVNTDSLDGDVSYSFKIEVEN